jgi:hypothetical protein
LTIITGLTDDDIRTDWRHVQNAAADDDATDPGDAADADDDATDADDDATDADDDATDA